MVIDSEHSDTSDSNIFLVTNRDRFWLFFKLYWRSFITILAPFVLMPIAFIGTDDDDNRKAYKCFYVFVLSSVYWISDAMHPAVAALVPIAYSSVMGATGHSFIGEMGILEIYETVGKAKQKFYYHGERQLRPTGYTTFYFLGIAYSSSIGAMATLMSSQTNQILKIYCEKIFPTAPQIDFPNVMLVNLPGVILMETILYFWMNFYFVGMFRSSVHLEISMTEEEAQYVKTLITAQVKQLGKVTLNEGIVISVVLLTALLQATVSVVFIESADFIPFHNHLWISSPCLMSVLLLFILPKNQDFLDFFKKPSNTKKPLAQIPCEKCLSWAEVRDNMHWGVLIIIGCASTLFESLQSSHMTTEFEKFLLYFKNWPPVGLILVIVVFCKVLTELAPGPCVAYTLLPLIARVSIMSKMNPHYLMMGATNSISLSFHLVTGAPVNAMVASYMHIPHKMIWGGLVPSIFALAVAWFTAAIWCAAILPDTVTYTEWTKNNAFQLRLD